MFPMQLGLYQTVYFENLEKKCVRRNTYGRIIVILKIVIKENRFLRQQPKTVTRTHQKTDCSLSKPTLSLIVHVIRLIFIKLNACLVVAQLTMHTLAFN